MNDKKKVTKGIFLGLWLISLLATSSHAAGLSYIIDSDGMPVIDGKADRIYEDAIAYYIQNLVTGSVSSTADLSASYKALWDDAFLYLLIEVTDEAVATDSINTWEDDGIEIYLDADHSQLTSYGPKDYLYTWKWGEGTLNELAHGALTGVVFEATGQTGGYTLEIKRPWKTLDVTATTGKQIGLDIHINDDDDGGTRDGKLTWHTLSNTSDADPSTFGTAELYRIGNDNGIATTATETESTTTEIDAEITETAEELPTEAELASRATWDETLSLLTALEQSESADRTRLNALAEEVRQDPNLSEHERFVVAARVGGLAIKETSELSRTARFAAYESLAKTLMAEFPEQPEPYESLLALANDQPDPTLGKQLAEELLASAAPEPIKTGAQRLLARKDMIGQPLTLNYQDSQGVTLDLQTYRGNIVLLYIWTALDENSPYWISDLLGQGSEEIVCIGLNLDADRQTAEAKINEVALDSLQIYDSGGLTGSIAEQLHLSRVPSLYLIDRSGVVRTVNPWMSELGQKLNQLLQEGGQS